jgi:PAS fold
VATDLEFSLRYCWREFLRAQELAMPGFMTLCAIRQGGEIVDFEWDYMNAAAARMFVGTPRRMIGQRLLDSLPGREGPSAVFVHYRRVADGLPTETFQHQHVGNGIDGLIRHVVTRLGDGVAVTLSNPAAVTRADALRVELMRHRTHLQQQIREDRLRERQAACDPHAAPLLPEVGLRVPQPSAGVIGQAVRWRIFSGVSDFLARCRLTQPGAIAARSFGAR